MSRKALAVKILVWLVVVIAVFGVGFCLIYQARHPVIDYVESRGPTENKADQGGDKVAAVQQTSTEPNHQTTQNEQSHASKWADPIVILTLALVIGVFVTNCIYYWQLREMRKTVALVGAQLLAMEEQAKQSEQALNLSVAEVKTMGQQADAALLQTKLAAKQIDLMIQNERARMGVRSIKPIGLDGQRRLAVQITFRNGGKSSAFGFRDYARVDVLNAGEMPAEFEWRDITPIFRRSFIPAGEDRSTIVDFFGLEDPEGIADGSKVLFVDGEARYSILGGENKILCFWGDLSPR